jgi:hypothetical protein
VVAQIVVATAVRENGWWEITLPVLGTATSARRFRDVRRTAQECAELWLDLPEGSVEIELRVLLAEAVRTEWESARALAERARVQEAEAAAMSRHVVQSMRADGLTLSEVGELLGLSTQRVHQLTKARATG